VNTRARFVLLSVVLLTLNLYIACGGYTSSTNTGNNAGAGSAPTPSGSNPGGSGGTNSGGTTAGGSNPGGSGSGSTGSGSGGGSSTVSPATEAQLTVETVAQNLQEPWSLAFAPDGRLFFTEAPGRLRVIVNGSLIAAPVVDLTANNAGFEGGLTGMDLDRNFSSNGFLYVHYCTTDNKCHVGRVVVTGNTGVLDRDLLTYPAPDFDHAGGRLKVGPDNLIYLGIGDHQVQASAQDPASWDGKIIRMNTDGSAAGSGFSNPYTYAIGLRDPQGLAFNASGALYATDHGPQANDEVDLISAGKNYGWPTCVGSCNNSAFVDPVLNLAPSAPSLPPSGATFYSGSTIAGWDGSLLIAVLGLDNNPQAHQLRQVFFNSSGAVSSQQSLFVNQFGRLRDVVQGPDGFVYIATSNYKQGSKAAPNDDRILRVRPK
jgi:glucose/arabinose dehydrogenase